MDVINLLSLRLFRDECHKFVKPIRYFLLITIILFFIKHIMFDIAYY